MHAPADVCFMYTTPLDLLLFEFLHMPSSVLFQNFVEFQDQSFYTQKNSKSEINVQVTTTYNIFSRQREQ